MRVSRAWRDIAARIQAGYGHESEELVKPGSLAIFCPACPQPGINLPSNWKDDKEEWVMAHLLILSTDSSFPVGYILGVS